MYISKAAILSSYLSLASATTVTFNGYYSDDSVPVSELACYKNGEIFKDQDWMKLGDITPTIAGFDGIDGPNSELCGTCWSLSCGYTSRSVLVLDGPRGGSGFTTSFTLMDSLTGGKAEKLGRVNVTAFQVELLNCGIATEPTEEEMKMVVGGNWYSNWLYDLYNKHILTKQI
ncbi:Cerato-platanin-domain-containing protein [Fusarium flagelliforme]|uniref:Heat-stable 19 kDa antigen n=1 Tax=Fusarium flagelliforme TaxID=2675880 RepID=A0A395N136_9HYPO|nr:Cerato-platanin-domain-containing protein [Fusarium flagelliforme]KAH7196441.1 Cerato-platanin-domain-containing protein [Fusarium flagelliforme]RFN53854.1 heat-stable 19 kda antigen [Fusarium flagelliforme]